MAARSKAGRYVKNQARPALWAAAVVMVVLARFSSAPLFFSARPFALSERERGERDARRAEGGSARGVVWWRCRLAWWWWAAAACAGVMSQREGPGCKATAGPSCRPRPLWLVTADGWELGWDWCATIVGSFVLYPSHCSQSPQREPGRLESHPAGLLRVPRPHARTPQMRGRQETQRHGYGATRAAVNCT